ncbi:MAG TPA: glycine--tRNA ligase subunit beta [Sphingomicrobium sp.]|nr:glycine--tRNA ligase subunit beta [Sphingomicrobium sp.]
MRSVAESSISLSPPGRGVVDFLLELLSEEIPARMQANARNVLARLFAECAEEAGLGIGPLDVFSTPRRLVLIARDVGNATEAMREEIKGPRTSAPPQALDGFLRKTGLAREQLEERDGVYFAVVERPGRAASEILGETVKRIVADFPWPKSMRWGDGSLRWVRPLHGIVAMLGEDIVPVEVGSIASGATTVGHRFHHPGAITVGGASDYAEKLRACHVIVDQEERERIIREGAEAAAARSGLTLLADEGLVVENAGLTEWPVPLLGEFDEDFLDVPREVIVLTMRTNQKYFACTASDGGLAPAFVCVANVAANDGGTAIVEGNRRVLAARLADARFFWEQDLKVPLEEQAKKLDGIIFHEKLGTVADKVERVAKLARWLVEEGIVGTLSPAGRGQGEGPATSSEALEPPHPNPLPHGKREDLADLAERAARLAKADLVTGMVGEFPELQGVIGGYLAEAQGEPKAVADAIRDHYKPVGQGDETPFAPASLAVALADKLDTLTGFFGINEKPTGSKDPFALRRATLGIISLIVENDLRAGFRVLLGQSLMLHGAFWWNRLMRALKSVDVALHERMQSFLDLAARATVPSTDYQATSLENLFAKRIPEDQLEDAVFAFADMKQQEIVPFFGERLIVQQRSAGIRHDIISAVFALNTEDDLVRLLARVKALQDFVETGEGGDLLTAYKRAANILKKEKWEAAATSDRGDLEPQEQALIDALDQAEPKASAAIDNEDFTGAMAALASLRTPIDDFFDHVTVNDSDPGKRERRLNLLMRFRDAVNCVADFSKIEG